MNYTTSRDTTARIRILACEPEPVVRKPSRWPVFAAAAVVAAVGVGGTLLLAPQQPPAQVLSPVSESVPVEPRAGISVATFRQTPAVHRHLRSAVSADLPAAAEVARLNRPVAPRTTANLTPPQAGAPAAQIPVAQAPITPRSNPAPAPVAQPEVNPAPVAEQPTAPIGPEGPDNVSDPTSPN